jgi:hypothetical protein
MTALVDHSRDHDLTVQGNQAARARALTHLLEIPGLPTISTWMVDAFTSALVGLVMPEVGEGPAEQQRKVAAWAAFLSVHVDEMTVSGTVTVSAEGLCEYGVHVRISTQFRAAIEESAA